MKTVTIYYETARGRKMDWTVLEENLEMVLWKCEFKEFKVIDWVYSNERRDRQRSYSREI